MTPRSSIAVRTDLRIAALAGAALVAACAVQPLNPYGRPYDKDNVLTPGPMPGCKGGHDVPPYLEFGSRAKYPATQHMNSRNGNVVVRVRIGADGRVEPLTVGEGPDKSFVAHTNAAMLDWRVRPATLKGVAVEVVCSFSQSYRIVGPWAPNAEDSERSSRL